MKLTYVVMNPNIMEQLVEEATENFTKVLSTVDIKNKYRKLYWGGNGVGDRWANKKFNYSVVYSKRPPTLYSENDDDEIPPDILGPFLESNKGSGIIGIFVHSRRTGVQKRPIGATIHKTITSECCVVCGTRSTVCDHKNDLYNDERVLDVTRQTLSDFQPLCNHCNLQKRQVCRSEHLNKKLFSAKEIPRYRVYPFPFPWEKKPYDKEDINCKVDTYWYDPVEFDRKVFCYSVYVLPVVQEVKRKVSIILS